MTDDIHDGSFTLISDIEEIREYFDNKSVAFIGPAPYLKGQGLGRIIDSYDIVCRIGDIYTKNLEVDLGSRTDIFMCCFQHEGSVAEIPFHLSTCEISKNIDYLVSMEKSVNIPNHKMTRDVGFKRFNSAYSGYIPPIILVKDEYINDLTDNKIMTPMGRRGARQLPVTGLMGICFLLDSFNLSSMFITGFSFYQDLNTFGGKYRKDYLDRLISSYNLSHNVTSGLKSSQINAFIRLMTADQSHAAGSTDKCLSYFRNTILNSYKEIIHLDEYTVRLLKLENIVKGDNIILFGDNQIGK